MANKVHRDESLINLILTRAAGSLKYVVLIIITVISVLPVLWVILSSFKTNYEILGSSIALPENWNFDGYIAAWKISPLPSFYLNSILISAASAFLNVAILSMSGYVLARFHFRLKSIIIITISISLFLPVTALIQPIYLTIKAIGLYDSKMALILVYTALGLPVSLFILRSYFLSIPVEIEEAAYVDGSGFFRTFLFIVLPIAKPGVATAAVLQFILSWNEYLFALVLTNSKENRTLPLALGYFTTQFSFNYTAMFAAVVMSIIPGIIIFIALQEQVVNSLTAGALKE